MFSKYQEMTKPLRDYNKHKVENWVDIQREQLGMQIAELNAEIGDLSVEEFSAKEFLRKVDIRKKIDEKVKQLQKLQGTVNQKVSSFLEEAEKEIAEFNHQFDIVPVLVINVVLKF
jgi:helicase